MDSWVILARVEDDASFFREGSRLDSEIFGEMVSTYDPAFRAAPVVSGFNRKTGDGGPSHTTGEHLLPLGRVEKLDFDGHNLWGLISEFEDDGVGRVTQHVADGFLQRSIGLWPNSPEVGGKAYLKHLAILGGEQPGIPNMPPLDQFFTSDSVSEMDARIIDSAPYEVRSILNPKEQPEMDLNEQVLAQLREILREEVSEAVSNAVTATRVAPEPEPTPEDDTEATQLMAELRTLRDEALELNVATREANLDNQLDEIVRAGRLLPADREEERKTLGRLAPEHQAERLEYLSTRSAILPSRLSASLLPSEIEEDVPFNLRNFVAPDGDARSLNSEKLSLYNEAMKRCEGDPAKFRQAAYAIVGETCGEMN